MRAFRIFAVVGLLLLGQGFAALPARALEAGELRDKLVEAFAVYNGAAGLDSGAGDAYRYSGLQVEPRDSDFRVTVKGLSLLFDPAKDKRLHLGDVAFTMTPEADADVGDLFRISDLQMPPVMTVSRGGESSDLQIKLGSIRLESLWSFAYLTNLNLDALVLGLEVLDNRDAASFTVAELTGEVRSLQQDGSVYDMTFDFKISDLLARKAGSESRAGQLDLLLEAEDYDLAQAVEIYRELGESAAAAATPEERLRTSLDLMLSPKAWTGGGGRIQLNARDVRIKDLADGSAVEFDTFGLGFGLTELDQPLARASLFLDHSGLRQNGVAVPAGTLEQELLPRETALKITMEKLPFRQIMSEVAATLGKPGIVTNLVDPSAGGQTGDPAPGGQGSGGQGPSSQEPDPLAMAMSPLVGKLHAAFTEAGTTIGISDTRLESRAAALELGGLFAIDPTAALGISGSLAAGLYGLDRLIELAQAAMGNPDPEKRKGAMEVIGLLGTLQAYAARSQADDGRTVDRYELVVEPSGAITVNGQPLLPAAPPPQ
ncbi:MAG: hypothetical protein OEM59_12050 [Rhodospirillales bacterium]|nr:hypothetical protein [Rhodospirillales bacterium]